jgi:hypothetical protein
MLYKRATVSIVVVLCSLSIGLRSRADILRWDTWEVIPGTEGIEPGPGAQLDNLDLECADLAGLDLAGANFEASSLRDADLSRSTLSDASFLDAVVTGAKFADTTSRGFTKEQLYSTASYKTKNLRGIKFGPGGNNLDDWDFSGQDLRYAGFSGRAMGGLVSMTGTNFASANLTNSSFFLITLTAPNFVGANLANASFASSLSKEGIFDSTTVYNQWTRFLGDFDPLAAGLTLVESATGDFDASNALDANDLDWLSAKARNDEDVRIPFWLPDEMFDVNSDRVISAEDQQVWVHDLKKTWYGDANLNGEFNATDLMQVLEAGRYETQAYAGWAEGDWNGDGVFDTGDLVKALDGGGYEQGPRKDPAAVPEPTGWLLFVLGGALCLWRRRLR